MQIIHLNVNFRKSFEKSMKNINFILDVGGPKFKPKIYNILKQKQIKPFLHQNHHGH